MHGGVESFTDGRTHDDVQYIFAPVIAGLDFNEELGVRSA